MLYVPRKYGELEKERLAAEQAEVRRESFEWMGFSVLTRIP